MFLRSVILWLISSKVCQIVKYISKVVYFGKKSPIRIQVHNSFPRIHVYELEIFFAYLILSYRSRIQITSGKMKDERDTLLTMTHKFNNKFNP